MAGCHRLFVKSLLTASFGIVMFHFFNIIFKMCDSMVHINNIAMKYVYYFMNIFLKNIEKIYKLEIFYNNNLPMVQTTQNFNIAKITSSRRRVAATYSTEDEKFSEVMGRIELDSHADTIVAGANCCILEYTGRICDVSPYSDEYKPVTGVPIVKAATIWQSQYTGQEYLLILNEALWMPNLPNTLINPNQLRAHGTQVQDNPYSGEPLFIQSHNKKFNMELLTNGTIIYANSRTPMNEDLHSGDLPMVELCSPNK